MMKRHTNMDQTQHNEILHRLTVRASMIALIREFFVANGYLEVETPVRIPAPAPEVHIDAQPSGSWYLQTSPELCMKRMVAAGFDRIFQICKCFRKGERGQPPEEVRRVVLRLRRRVDGQAVDVAVVVGVAAAGLRAEEEGEGTIYAPG